MKSETKIVVIQKHRVTIRYKKINGKKVAGHSTKARMFYSEEDMQKALDEASRLSKLMNEDFLVVKVVCEVSKVKAQ